MSTSASAPTTAAPTAAPTARPARRRIFYLDLVRALATLLIVLTHFNNPFFSGGGYLFTNTPFGIYVGGVGVSLFLIISGASLGVTYRNPINLKKFFWKRFKGIYPMFWTAWLLGTIYFFIDSKGRPMNAAPVRSLIWTVLGIDGLVANFHIKTAYLLGEWFLGFIIIFYLVFPLLSWGLTKHPLVTAGVILALYVATVLLTYKGTSFSSAILLTTRLPELAFGVYFARRFHTVHPLVVLPATAVLVVSGLLPTQIPEDVATTLVGISCFLILVVVSRYIAIKPVRAAVGWVSKYSYPIFLVHHVVIFKLFFFSNIPWNTFNRAQLLMLLITVCVLTFALSVALDRLTKQLVAFVADAFARTPSSAQGDHSGQPAKPGATIAKAPNHPQSGSVNA